MGTEELNDIIDYICKEYFKNNIAEYKVLNKSEFTILLTPPDNIIEILPLLKLKKISDIQFKVKKSNILLCFSTTDSFNTDDEHFQILNSRVVNSPDANPPVNSWSNLIKNVMIKSLPTIFIDTIDNSNNNYVNCLIDKTINLSHIKPMIDNNFIKSIQLTTNNDNNFVITIYSTITLKRKYEKNIVDGEREDEEDRDEGGHKKFHSGE
jgi:hypothetical protein